MGQPRILIIDDEEGVRSSLGLILADEGYRVRAVGDATAALEAARGQAFDVVLCDVRMPRRSGLDLLPDLVAAQPDATVLMMSAYGDVDQALEAVRRGAYDYLAKPFQSDELLLTIRKAEERERLRRENRRLQRELERGRGRHSLVAASEAMQRVVELCERAAAYKTTVLITGESGVGKELVARTVHGRSARAERPFLAVNCAAIPETLIESELFGHARGAFTGADTEQLGLFREADGGTLLLDEVGELPPAVQAKLLRALQEEEVRPLGEPKPVPVDVRIVAATARDLEGDVAAGRFRGDLFYRLDVVRIHVPPLRQRPDDVPALADHLLRAFAARLGKPVSEIDDEAMAALCAYPWPGNVRELENTLERAIILAPGETVTPDLLPFATAPGLEADPAAPAARSSDLSIKRHSRRLEERLIRLALARTGGNRTRAARILELSPRALQYKIKEYDVDPLNPVPGGADTE